MRYTRRSLISPNNCNKESASLSIIFSRSVHSSSYSSLMMLVYIPLNRFSSRNNQRKIVRNLSEFSCQVISCLAATIFNVVLFYPSFLSSKFRFVCFVT